MEPNIVEILRGLPGETKSQRAAQNALARALHISKPGETLKFAYLKPDSFLGLQDSLAQAGVPVRLEERRNPRGVKYYVLKPTTGDRERVVLSHGKFRSEQDAAAAEAQRLQKRAAQRAALAAAPEPVKEKEKSPMMETIHNYHPGGLTDSQRQWMAEQLDKPRGVAKKDRADYMKWLHLDYLARQAGDPLLTYLPNSPVHVSTSMGVPTVACGLDTRRHTVWGNNINQPREAEKVDCPHCRLEMGLPTLPTPRTDVPRPTYPVGIQAILDAARKEGPEDYARNRVLRNALLRAKGDELMVEGPHGSRMDAESALAALQSAGINVVLQEVGHPTRYGDSVFYFTAPDGGERLRQAGLAALVKGESEPVVAAVVSTPAPDPWAYSGPVKPGSVYNYEDYPAPAAPSIAIADVNGDGKPDAIVTAPTLQEAATVGNAALDGLERQGNLGADWATNATPGLFDLEGLAPSEKPKLADLDALLANQDLKERNSRLIAQGQQTFGGSMPQPSVRVGKPRQVGSNKVGVSVKRARSGSRKWNPSGKRR